MVVSVAQGQARYTSTHSLSFIRLAAPYPPRNRGSRQYRRQQRSIDFYMDMSRKSSKVLFDELRKLRLSGDESSLTSVRAKIEDLAEHMEDYANSKQELEAGLEKLVQDHIDAARRRAAQVALKGSPLAQYILRIYLNPDLLYKNLFGTIYDYKLYRSGNLFFVTSVEEELPFSYLLCNQKGVVEEHILEEDRSFHWDEVQRDHYERKERAKRDRQERLSDILLDAFSV